MAVKRVLGVDPSSNFTGLAVVRKGKLLGQSTYRADPKLPIHERLRQFVDHMHAYAELYKVEKVVIERVSVQWNLDTIRKIAYFEAAAMIVAARLGLEVEQMNVSQARRRALGRSMKKSEAAAIVRERYAKDLSADECDAIVLALAG